MVVTKRSIMIPVDQLQPHPDNPRKDVGDVTELAESIKKNGIFQNLTVVRGGKGVEVAHPDEDDPDGYTVIIGHRRLAAAKAAGLETVPCMVVEMDKKEQIATMLLENMQRSDLTIYEQAQGFQMMLDLGETKADIAEKTGFSETTVRHRLKLLELDPIEFQKAQERQVTFSDYIELEKLKRPESKTEALKAIGTSSFKYTVERLISHENAEANAEKATAFLDSKLKKVQFDNRFQYRQIGYMPISKALTEERQKEIDDLIAKGAKYYTLSSDAPEFAWAYIYTDPVVESEEDRAEKQKRDELANMRRKREQKIKEEEQRAHDLRKKFVKDFANREYISTLTEALLTEPGLDDIDYKEVAELLGIELTDDDTIWDVPSKLAYKKIVREHPESLILAMLYTIFDCEYNNQWQLHDHEGRYERNPRLENWYAILTRVKYKMSSDERKLLSGTHDCFK